jgi:cob(I)alamin adenosyltransferase
MSVYTGGGDRGKTSLFSGERVLKCHERIEAYGDVDELCSVIGAIASVLPEIETERIQTLQKIQSMLLKAGAWMATTPDSSSIKFLEEFDPDSAKELEMRIDTMETDLPKLKSFILPGGHISASWAHIARTVCRRAERRVIGMLAEFEKKEEAGETAAAEDKAEEQIRHILVYLNRLSDYLFVLARHCNQSAGVGDIVWNK